MGDGRLTAIDVPVLGVVATTDEEVVVGHLGPDLCGPDLPDLGAVVTRMSQQPEQPLGAALLDQRNAAGFGNVYAVELPFIVGISPQQPIGSIDRLGDLVAVGAAVIRTNAARGPQNTTGRRLHAADHWIYAKRGRPCPLCAAGLDGYSDRQSPWGRATVWCPGCQPLEARRAVDLVRTRHLLALHPARRQPFIPFPGHGGRG
jgi:endonuclease-8